MKISISILALTIIYLFLYGCSADNTVTIKDFSPKGEVANLTTFTVEFSENLAPFDKQNKWLSDQFIIFEPKIEGKFKWLSGNTLIFSPDYPLEPIQSYKAEITDKVLFKSKLSPDFEDYEFHTPDFDAVKAEFFWSQIPNQSYKISIKGNLYFNYPVDPAKLKKFLEVRRNNEPKTDFQIMSETPSDIISINFGEISQTKKEQELSVNIKNGLMSIVGKKGLIDDRKFEQDLPPITDLAITSVTSGFDGNNSWILIYTTQTVDDKRIKDFISIKPEKALNFFVNENSFRIEGNFYDVQSAGLKIKKGLPGLYGGILDFDFEQEVVFVNLEPSITFSDKKGIYLMRTGLKNLDVNAVNISEAEIEVSQIFKNNILHFLNQNAGYYYNYDNEDDYYRYYREYHAGNFGKELYHEDVKLTERKNWLQNFSVNVDKALNVKYKGIFIVNVRSANDRWITDSKILSLSDLAIITKTANDQITVFVNSISEAEPVPDVQINIISSNNQSILSGTTNSEGIIQFNDIRTKTEGFTARLVTAEKGGDFNYIDLNQTMIETSRFDVGGVYEYSPDYNTYIYSERNLYRPGDKVNLSAIVRNKTIKVVNEIPIIVKIITPTGKIFGEFKKTLNEQGSFELTFEMSDYAQTGEYVAEVYSGPKDLLGSYRFSVEEFVPDKIRVMLKGNKEDAYPGDVLSVDINAEFLFGAKASGLKYETAFQYSHRSFYSENYPQFDFSNSSSDNATIKNTFRDGTLNQEGSAEVKDTLPGELSSKGIIVGNAHVSVFDLTGRTVNRFQQFKIYPQNYFIGIKAPGYYFSTNENLKFKIIAVNEKDKVISNFNAKATLIRYEWQTVLKKDNSGRYYYDSDEKEIKEWEKPIELSGGPKDFTFNVSNSGRYQLRISKEGKKEYVFDDFYAWGWRSSTSSSFAVNR
ncbi:MAG: MG2 domain-containing protein, partial [Ignavibacteria bacterium]